MQLDSDFAKLGGSTPAGVLRCNPSKNLLDWEEVDLCCHLTES